MKITNAALLHDIGKFYQRTNYSLGKNNLYLGYVKSNGTYVHGGFTCKFIDEFLNSNLDELYKFIKESSNHHKEEDFNDPIKRADFIASGHDRKDSNYIKLEENEEIADLNIENYVIKRMNSIFDEVRLDKNQINERHYVELSVLNNYKTKASLLDKKNSRNEYTVLFDKMISEIKEERIYDITSYKLLHHLLYPILKKYTCYIPSTTYNVNNPTVSLFDHSKLTAAIANCLQHCEDENFAFIDYDVSGIQSFIYKITEGRESKKNIAKSLRTRSFYIGVLTDFIAYYIVNNFKLTYENVLYSSGGRGRILVPKIKNFEEIINNIIVNIERNLFNLHQGEISYTIFTTDVKGIELQSSKLGDLVDFDKRNYYSDKKQKFKTVFTNNNFNSVEEPYKKLCSLCNSSESINNGYCEFCNNLLDLNNLILTKTDNFIIEFRYNNKIIRNCKKQLFIGDIGSIVFYDNKNFDIDENSYFQSINNYYIGESKTYAKSNIGNKSFEDIAMLSEGDPKLAVIKMDVDNLGYIFANGIDKDTDSLSKSLTLSRMIDFFFTKNLVDICNREKYKNAIYIDYAGGDDLVIISPASMAIELSYDITEEFRKFTNYNPCIHLSTGIEIFHPHSPVRYAIDKAEEALSKSKEKEEKNSLTTLNSTVTNKDLKDLIEKINLFSDGLNNNTLSKSGLYEIYSYILMALDNENTETAFMRFIPLIAYSIKRNMSSNWFKILQDIFIINEINVRTLEYYKIVFAFALLKTRKEN